jgi:hypothetical protein
MSRFFDAGMSPPLMFPRTQAESAKLTVVIAAAFAPAVAPDNAMAQAKSEKCAAYVREAARQTPAQTFRAA